MSETEIRNIIEAALFAAGKSLNLSELSLLFEDAQRPDAAAIRAALDALAQDYIGRPIEIARSRRRLSHTGAPTVCERGSRACGPSARGAIHVRCSRRSR
jgi:chromosome segregation and condensation protein ScpB